jgi:hypothetical protein
MKYIFKNIYVALIVPLLFTSCLKDKEIIGPDADGSVSNVIEFGDITSITSGIKSTYPLYIQTFDIVPSYDINVPVKLVGVFNKEEVSVTVEVDNSILSTYNDENETDYVEAPNSFYTIGSSEVVIPNGERESKFNLKMLPENFDFDNNYAIGLRIKSINKGSGVISGNFGAIILAVSPKNPLDGQYTWTGTLEDVTAPAFTSATTRRTYTVQLRTIGPDKVAFYDPYVWADYMYPFYTGTGWSGYGSFAPVFTFDLTTNKITAVTNYYGQPAANTRSAELDPAGENTYDPATKTIKVSYFMLQPSSVAASPHIRSIMHDEYIYSGVR